MKEIKNKIEALLFSSARSMSVDEISNLVKVSTEEVKKILEELKKKYENSEATELIQEGDHWKLAVRDKYVPLVSSIVTQTELSKTLMETLAVIAFKYPIKQSDVIKVRTNKAYDHLRELEEQGFITRQRYGRTRLIKLAQKFFDYFDLPREKLKEKFKDFESLAHAIEEKESIIEKMKQRKSKIFVDLKNNSFSNKEKIEKEKTEVIKEAEVDLVDEKGKKVKLEVVDETETYEEEPEALEIIEEKDKIGDLEVIDVSEKKEEEPEQKEVKKVKKKKEEFEEIPEDLEEESDIMEELQEKKVKTDFEKEVDKKVDELLHPKKEEEEEGEEGEDLLEASQEEENKE